MSPLQVVGRAAIDLASPHMTCALVRCSGEDRRLQMTGQCHPGSPVIAVYQSGVLTLSCAACGLGVVALAIGEPA